MVLIGMLLPGRSLCFDSAPALTWVKTIGGSGTSSVVAAAADGQGNFYIAGNTTSPADFPATVGGITRGTTLIRIDARSGAAEKLYPADLSGLSSIAPVPGNRQVLYAAAGSAVFRSTDAGSTWSGWSQVDAGASIRFLTVNPSNGEVLYTATTTKGIFKSTDAGMTWMATNNGIAPRPDGAISAARVWVDPWHSQVLFASTNAGLMRSADAGGSWTVISTSVFADNSLTFDPFATGTIYVGEGSMVLRSVDDGSTFQPLSGMPDQSSVSAITADPLLAGVLYAGTYSGVFRSSDSGLTWTRKLNGPVILLAADPGQPAFYAVTATGGMIKTTDGFTTASPIGLPVTLAQQIVFAGTYIFEVAAPSNDVFAVKLAPDGSIVYAVVFGGSAEDAVSAMALGADGSLYITGATTSVDFPTTLGGYAGVKPGVPGSSSSFVSKLNPDGTLGWSTYFADLNTTTNAIAVDSDGNSYIAGATTGNLPTTPGAYQTNYAPLPTCGFFCLPPATAAFVTKFNADGAALIYSTYVPEDTQGIHVAKAQALVVDGGGNAYLGGSGNLIKLNATGTALLASVNQMGIDIVALALGADSNLYATGNATPGYSGTGMVTYDFPASPGAFQPSSQPAVPLLPGQMPPGGFADAFIMKWDNSLTKILAATLVGGELGDYGESIAIDKEGNILISGETDSKAFPTRGLFQAPFSARAGFAAGFDSTLSHLLFSTYLGDTRPFDARAVAPDGNGGILLAGSTLGPGSAFVGGEPGQSFTVANQVVANRIALPPAPAVRLDSIVNFASRLAGAIAPGEPILARGSGFGAEAQLFIDGTPVSSSITDSGSLVAVIPESAKTTGVYQVQVSTAGMVSNAVYVPAAPASPGIYSTDGSGYGQGYIFNSDGTLNSPSNPASPGSAITIFAAGAGRSTVQNGYAVSALQPSVFVDGFYANGIAAKEGPVPGLAGNVYQIGVYVPDPAKLAGQNPNLLNFQFPAQVGVRLVMGAVSPFNPDNSEFVSQGGIVLNIK